MKLEIKYQSNEDEAQMSPNKPKQAQMSPNDPKQAQMSP